MRHASWIVTMVVGLVGCEDQQKKDCDATWSKLTDCSARAMRHREIATGPERESQLEAWRGDLRVCAGMADAVEVKTPAVRQVLIRYGAVYAASEPRCTEQSCGLEVPKEDLKAAQAAHEAACPP